MLISKFETHCWETLAIQTWEFPKIRGTLFGSPYNKDPSIWGTILGSPIFGNSHILFRVSGLGVQGLCLGFRVQRLGTRVYFFSLREKHYLKTITNRTHPIHSESRVLQTQLGRRGELRV